MGHKRRYLAKNASFGPNSAGFLAKNPAFGGMEKNFWYPHIREPMIRLFRCGSSWLKNHLVYFYLILHLAQSREVIVNNFPSVHALRAPAHMNYDPELDFPIGINNIVDALDALN